MPDPERQEINDTSRPSATRYSLSLEDVSRLFEEAGLPRNNRSLQRYCAAGRLDCIKEETVSGLAYFVDPASVGRAITQLAQLHGITDDVRHAATDLDMAHRVAPNFEPKDRSDAPRPSAAERDKETETPQDRPAPTEPDTSRIVALLENANASLREQNAFFRDQIGVKDTQIAALLERDKETNYLVRGLQTMLAPLLGSPAPYPPKSDDASTQEGR